MNTPVNKPVSNSQNSDQELVDFARTYGPSDVKYGDASLSALSGDAGFRRYYRLSSTPTLMMVDSPPDKERNLEYVRVSDFLAKNAVRVPRIHAVDFELGIFVVEDLGNLLLQNELNANTAEKLYSNALDLLLSMQTSTQRLDQRPEWIQEYSEKLLLDEMGLFSEWFIEKLLGIELTPTIRLLIDQAFERMSDSALEQPKVFVHRDFHSRNLMLLENQQVATIDFQDAVWGPITYDLVSLCRDCYVYWHPQKVDEVTSAYAKKLLEAKLLNEAQLSKFPRWLDWMGLQRHIKVLGIFSRLHLRDNKSQYLNDLPLVLRYVLDVLPRYPEVKEFSRLNTWLRDKVIPAAELQPWCSDGASDWTSAGDQLEF